MTSRLLAVTIDARDPSALAGFWSRVLGREQVADARGGTSLLPTDEPGFRIRFVADDSPHSVSHQTHFDLTSTSLADQQSTVYGALDDGASHLDVGQLPEEEHVVLADPEGNPFCVVEPGNRFLEGCGVLGALSCDGSQQVGYFWSAALDWPLVWDQDEETAIQSPLGGSKISWGGPPYDPKTGKNKIHLDLLGDENEVARLVGLGATPVDIGQGEVDWTVLADPDGNEFCVLPAGQLL